LSSFSTDRCFFIDFVEREESHQKGEIITQSLPGECCKRVEFMREVFMITFGSKNNSRISSGSILTKLALKLLQV